jgi:hypothetical protein
MVITKVEGLDILQEYLIARQKRRVKLNDFIKKAKRKKQNGR